MPPPVSPNVKDGRMMAGRPTKGSASIASSTVWAIFDFGLSRPILSIASRNLRRSSAFSMTSALAPIISTPRRANTPAFSRASAQFSAVCPPMVGSTASGRSFSRIFSTTSGVIGSM